eukprot:XP_001700510.1 predicted protein [Chlamydomonas reinhardtii]
MSLQQPVCSALMAGRRILSARVFLLRWRLSRSSWHWGDEYVYVGQHVQIWFLQADKTSVLGEDKGKGRHCPCKCTSKQDVHVSWCVRAICLPIRSADEAQHRMRMGE